MAPVAGTVVTVAAPGERVAAGAAVAVIESMKMEHEVVAEGGGVADARERGGRRDGRGGPAAARRAGRARRAAARGARRRPHATRGRARPRDAVLARHALGLDDARPEAVARRREQGRRTARENVADLVDEGTFVEYGPLIFAAQERRRPKDELIARTPADGLVGGVGEIDGQPAVVASYDYTVLAGTQGMRNHLKKDRLFELAERRRLPSCCSPRVGEGGRATSTGRSSPGSTAARSTCSRRLSGLVPLVGHRRRATASPATPRCSAAATW